MCTYSTGVLTIAALACASAPAFAGEQPADDAKASRALYAQGMQALDAHNYAGVSSVNVGSWSLAAGVGGA
jgi:hypothetical protein